jgi:hypothetical protein
VLADGDHVRGFSRLVAITALFWAAFVGVGQAAVEIGDAGDLPATAQDLGAESALGAVGGTLDGLGDRDVYRACLTGGGSFSASTVGGTDLDTQLFLLDADGRGVYANDDAPDVIGQSALPAGDPLTPAAAGVYYLAVARFNQDPTSAAGDLLFPDLVSTVAPLSGDPVAAWTAGREGAFGAYTIALTGVVPCAVPDTTAPTIDLRTPADGATYEVGEAVAADYDCADEDGGSGVAACDGTVADGAQLDTSAAGPAGFTVSARDGAGNESAVTHSYTVVDPADETGPTIDLRTPADDASFAVGETVVADYECADEDGGSGLATCVGDVADGDAIDTAAAGDRTFTVTATDNAGNVTVRTVAYTVDEGGFDFDGFLPPLGNPPAVNRAKAGGIVAVRFRLGGDKGDDVLARRFPRSADVSCRTFADADPADAEPTDAAWSWWRWWGDGLRFQPWNGTYVYLWRTERRWAGDCRQLIVKLSDGSIHRANVAFAGKRGRGHSRGRWD